MIRHTCTLGGLTRSTQGVPLPRNGTQRPLGGPQSRLRVSAGSQRPLSRPRATGRLRA